MCLSSPLQVALILPCLGVRVAQGPCSIIFRSPPAWLTYTAFCSFPHLLQTQKDGSITKLDRLRCNSRNQPPLPSPQKYVVR
jgi:hypothetical protein